MKQKQMKYEVGKICKRVNFAKIDNDTRWYMSYNLNGSKNKPMAERVTDLPSF